MNPLKSFVRHALHDADPEPEPDRPQLEMRQTQDGEFQLVETETNHWIGCDPADCIDLEEVA